MMPMQHDYHDYSKKKTEPPVFTVHQTSDGRYNALGRGIIDFSDKELLSELFETATNSGKQTGVIREYDLKFFVNNNHMFRSVMFADILLDNAMKYSYTKTLVIIRLKRHNNSCIF